MSRVRKREKVSLDFMFLMSGYIRSASFTILVPQYLIHLLYIFMVSEMKKQILSSKFHVSDGICSSVSSLSRIFELSRVFRKITFSIGTIIIDVYPWINKYKINDNEYLDIKSLVGNAWNYSKIKNIADGVKLMVALHRKTSDSCKCSKDAYMEITIFNENKKIPTNECAIFSSTIDDVPWYCFDSSIDDAYIQINITEDNLQHIDDGVFITIYDGNIYSYEEWRCKGIVEGICCANAANEGCDDQYVLDDDELYFIADPRWEIVTNKRKNALNEYYSKCALLQ